MFIIHVLFFILGFWFFLLFLNWIAQFWLKRKMKKWRESMSEGDVKQTTTPESQELLPCARCGVFVMPESGIRKNGAFYCSKEHAKA